MKLIDSVVRSFRKLLAFFPTRLPIGLAQFEVWFQDITYLYGLPQNDSVRFALGTMIMHSSPTNKPGVVDAVVNSGASYYKSKRYFGLTALKGAANQTAHQVMSDCKARQDDANKKSAESAQKATEDAATGKPKGLKLAEATGTTGSANVPESSPA